MPPYLPALPAFGFLLPFLADKPGTEWSPSRGLFAKGLARPPASSLPGPGLSVSLSRASTASNKFFLTEAGQVTTSSFDFFQLLLVALCRRGGQRLDKSPLLLSTSFSNCWWLFAGVVVALHALAWPRPSSLFSLTLCSLTQAPLSFLRCSRLCSSHYCSRSGPLGGSETCIMLFFDCEPLSAWLSSAGRAPRDAPWPAAAGSR